MYEQTNATLGTECTGFISHITRLHSNKDTKLNVPGIYIYIYMKLTAYDGTTTSGTVTENFDNNGKVWYFWFDDDNKTSNEQWKKKNNGEL